MKPCPCGAPQSAHSYGLCPANLNLAALMEVKDWVIKDEHDNLVCRATGNGFAQCFAIPNYVQEYAAWCRYLRVTGQGINIKSPRGFANEFDLILVPREDAEIDGIQEAARLLTRPYSGRDWYGSIYQEDRRRAEDLVAGVDF